jgi:hypothetical protein
MENSGNMEKSIANVGSQKLVYKRVIDMLPGELYRSKQQFFVFSEPTINNYTVCHSPINTHIGYSVIAEMLAEHRHDYGEDSIDFMEANTLFLVLNVFAAEVSDDLSSAILQILIDEKTWYTRAHYIYVADVI